MAESSNRTEITKACKGILHGTALPFQVDGLRCPRCDWEGDRKEAEAREGGLLFYDILFKDQFKIELTRTNYHCPNCGNMIESRRAIPGMPEDMTPQ